jgi:predicted GIY-YIG superfamily endonuclease
LDKEFVVYKTGHISRWLTTKIDNVVGNRFVYVLECEGNQYYCGMTSNLVKRLVEHTTNNGSVFTRHNTPINLVHLEPYHYLSDALNRETQLTKQLRNKEFNSFNIPDRFKGIYQFVLVMITRYDEEWLKKHGFDLWIKYNEVEE